MFGVVTAWRGKVKNGLYMQERTDMTRDDFSFIFLSRSPFYSISILSLLVVICVAPFPFSPLFGLGPSILETVDAKSSRAIAISRRAYESDICLVCCSAHDETGELLLRRVLV